MAHHCSSVMPLCCSISRASNAARTAADVVADERGDLVHLHRRGPGRRRRSVSSPPGPGRGALAAGGERPPAEDPGMPLRRSQPWRAMAASRARQSAQERIGDFLLADLVQHQVHQLGLGRHIGVERHGREPSASPTRRMESAARPSASAMAMAARTTSSTEWRGFGPRRAGTERRPFPEQGDAAPRIGGLWNLITIRPNYTSNNTLQHTEFRPKEAPRSARQEAHCRGVFTRSVCSCR